MITKKEYQQIVKNSSPKSKCFVNGLKAFLIGGGICTLGQGLTDLYVLMGINEEVAKTLCSVSLIFLGVFMTAIHRYDDIAKHAGAGTLVPITGFANSIASPAIEFKSEGFILGVGAKMFSIAGPVITYGVSASVAYGVVYWVMTLFK